MNPHNGGHAETDDPSTWAPRENAEARARKLGAPGQVGLILGPDAPGPCVGGCDLDGCLDPDGTVAPWGRTILDQFVTYTEISPSGTGVKAFFVYDPADLPALRDAWAAVSDSDWGPTFDGGHCGPAIHLGHRFYAVTGRHLPGSPRDLRPVSSDTITWLATDFGPMFKAAKAGERDEAGGVDGSAELMKVAASVKRTGGTFADYLAAAEDNPDASAHVAKHKRERSRDRALRRAWERATGLPDLGDLDELEDLDAEDRGGADGWTIAAFDPDGDPDLSHDELALDLGRAGWNRDARYCAPLGGWLLWRGQHWEPSPGMQPMAVVRGFVRSKARLLVEWAEKRAAKLDPAEGEKLIAWAKAQAKTLRHDSGIAAVERLARSNVKALAVPEQFDSDDFLLGTPGGTVDLRTGGLREAARGDYITRLTSVAPAAPGEQPEAWLRFLGEVFPGDPEMVGFMQRLAGYALTGSTREHRLFLFHGSGRNGKGTLLGTLQGIMGDYAKGIPTATLLEARSPQHASPLARLRGARFVRGAELPVGQVWNESLVKQLTGGDSITANLMRQDAFDFVPKFTLIVDGNTKPRIRTTDVAMRSRMTLIPFAASFAGREDRELPDRLKAEAGAILRWAIDGAVAWQRDGLRIPAAVDLASRDYLDSEDSLAHFLEDETVAAPGNRLPASALYSRYRCWAADQGVAAATQRAFGGMLSERGVERYRDMHGRGFVGLRVRDPLMDEDEDGL